MVGVPGSSTLKTLKKSVPAALLLFACGTVAASAYYTDVVKAEDSIRVAGLDFSIDGYGILADLSEEGQHLLPFSDGESFEVSFQSRYNGSVDCIVIPKLSVTAENAGAGDIIEITDGSSQQRITDGSADLYSDPFICSPGENVERIYRITIVKHEGADPLLFDYDFTLAAAQAYANAGLMEERVGKEAAFDSIADDYHGTRDAVIGFTDLIGASDTCDLESGMFLKNRPRSHVVKMVPEITPGKGPEHAVTWYLIQDGAESGPFTPGEDDGLTLLLRSGNGAAVRYEAVNEAGIAASAVYELKIEGEEVQISEKAYEPDYG